MSTPSLRKEVAVSTTNRFMAAVVTKKTKFVGLDIEINKLSVQQTVDIRAKAKELEDSQDEMSNFKLICEIVRMGAKDLIELSDEELQTLPLDDLAKLSEDIMAFSGLTPKEQKK